MTDLEALMREWLESGSPIQRQHAGVRIAMGFEGVVDDPPAPPPPPPPVPADWVECAFRDRSCSCGRRLCLHTLNGPKFGTPRPTEMPDKSIQDQFLVDPESCRACLSA